ncbi:MAG: prepilin-type N-terminal cleavage/methylation domain-containing protein, partial [Proteobacteria bacterium]|nr:prepilin-type N-terminal cleavage/methylation domain-containing protein [Pseudomonadota bacterium]
MKFKKNSRGFTLIEVAIAIAIFGIALSSLIALQTRLVDNFIRERKLLRATLAAQYLMTFIEIESDPPGPQDNTTDLISELKKRGYFDDNIFDKLEEQYKGWKV